MNSDIPASGSPAHVRLARPDATQQERRTAQQARVGILRNPAEPALPTPAPRDVWRRWPRLRSTRRPGQRPDTALSAGSERPSGCADGAPAIASNVLDGSALAEFARALRSEGPAGTQS